MPTVRKKVLKAKSDRPKDSPKLLTQRRYESLVDAIAEITDGEKVFNSLEDRRTCWDHNKETILRRWFSNVQNFCRRPEAWWQFENPPSSQVIGYRKLSSGTSSDLVEIWEPYFLRIERSGDLRDFEKATFQEEKSSFYLQLQRMREIGLFFDSREEFEKWESERSTERVSQTQG